MPPDEERGNENDDIKSPKPQNNRLKLIVFEFFVLVLLLLLFSYFGK